MSGGEDGGIPFIKEDCIPDIGSASTQTRRDEKTYVHLGSQGTGVSSNIAAYAKKHGVKRMAFLVFNDPSAIQGAENYSAAFKSQRNCHMLFRRRRLRPPRLHRQRSPDEAESL